MFLTFRRSYIRQGYGTKSRMGGASLPRAIFGVLGVAVSLLMFFNPAAAPVTSEVEITEELEVLVASYAIRNSITALVLLLAVWIRTPGALFAAVSGRLITELLDAARVVSAGAGPELILLLALIVPAVLVLWKLWPSLQIEMTTAR